MDDPQEAERRRSALRRAELPPEALVSRDGSEPRFVLESPGESGQLRRMLLQPLPFRIGRQPGLELVLPSELVSKTHAEIYERDGTLRVRDLGSLNGTFLNREAIADAPLKEGDILYLADFEFRLACPDEGPEAPGEDFGTLHRAVLALPRRFRTGTRELKDLLNDGLVTMAFQPILRLPGGEIAAYEALGRGRHPGLPESPLELFQIAATVGAEAELSRLFRRRALELVRELPEPPALFLNTHPAENESELVASLEELRVLAPQVDVFLEIHESTLARPDYIAALRQRLSEINVGLAYDDFGSGQSRLLELAEAPPHYLKFDRCFITGLEKAPPSRRRFLGALVEACRELRVKTVAEGVETQGEADACRQVGFTHVQGYFFGRPISAEQLVSGWRRH